MEKKVSSATAGGCMGIPSATRLYGVYKVRGHAPYAPTKMTTIPPSANEAEGVKPQDHLKVK